MQSEPTLSAPLAAALTACPLVAVLRWITPAEILGATAALVDSGFRLIEVPLNSPDALTSIEMAAQEFGDAAIIGAGTVMSPAAVNRVKDAGGRLIVTPHGDTDVIRAAAAQQMACIPGVATPTEGFAALAAGAHGLKLFPAEAMSPAVLKAWRAVYPMRIPLLPTGGITPDAMQSWVTAGASGFGIGGNLYRPGVDAAELRRRAETFVAAWAAAAPNAG